MKLEGKNIYKIEFMSEKLMSAEEKELRDTMVHLVLNEVFALENVVTNGNDTVGHTPCDTSIITNVKDDAELIDNPFLIFIGYDYVIEKFLKEFNQVFKNGEDEFIVSNSYVTGDFLNKGFLKDVDFTEFPIFKQYLLENLTKDNVLDKLFQFGKESLTELDYEILNS